MDDLITEFIAESREMLAALEGELVAWEHDPGDRERLDAIFRFFHTVKGNCGFFDLPRLQALSHAAEEVLVAVRNGKRQPDPALVDAVLAAIDRIAELIDAVEAGGDLAAEAARDAPLIAALQADAAPALAAGPVSADGEHSIRRAAVMARTVRLPVDLVDEIMSGVSDMILVRNEIERQLRNLGDHAPLQAPFGRLSAVLTNLQGTITRARMQPIGTLFASYLRMGRDLAAELGKQVRLELENSQVEIDREMIEVIRDPLMHIIRNAIDHGIESPAERRAAGKPETGRITLTARQAGNEIRIGIFDDGRGIDGGALVAKAISRGVLTAEEAEGLDERHRNALICEPGLSTAREVTNISGRGVGMDVVRDNIERIGGSLAIDSTVGAGTQMLLYVPLTLSIVPSITVRSGNHVLAMPRSYVDEIVGSGAEVETERIGGVRQIDVRGSLYPCVGLGRILDVDNSLAPEQQTIVMIKMINGAVFGLGVDAIVGHEELVVRPVAPEVSGTGLYVGVAQLDDGYPALMLDVLGLAKSAGMINEIKKKAWDADEAVAEDAGADLTHVVVFEGFDGLRKAVRMSAVERLFVVDAAAVGMEGGAPHVVVDSRVVPLAGVDAALPQQGRIKLIIVGDGANQVAYAARGAIDTDEIELSTATGGTGRQVAVLGGAMVELLDCHDLFVGRAEAPVGEDPVWCRLPAGDRWSREFLRPLVEAAGYRVTDDDAHPVDVEVRFERDAERASEAASASELLLLSTRRSRAAAERGAIYRYDREALLDALDAVRIRRAK
ncbi:MAG: chemotaxis protein CheA [Novosphingobium sp.]